MTVWKPPFPLILLLLLLVGGAHAADYPDWMRKRPEPTSDYVYFVGHSAEATDLNTAITQARHAALTQAIQEHFGAEYITATYTHQMPAEHRLHLDHQTRMASPLTYVRGFEEVERHLIEPDRNGKTAVAVLFRWKKSDLQLELGRHRAKAQTGDRRKSRRISQSAEPHNAESIPGGAGVESDHPLFENIGSHRYPTDVTIQLNPPNVRGAVYYGETQIGSVPGRFVGVLPPEELRIKIEAPGYEVKVLELKVQEHGGDPLEPALAAQPTVGDRHTGVTLFSTLPKPPRRRASQMVLVELEPLKAKLLFQLPNQNLEIAFEPALIPTQIIELDSTLSPDQFQEVELELPYAPQVNLRITGAVLVDYTQSLNIKPGATYRLSPPLEFRPGRLSFDIKPKTASLELRLERPFGSRPTDSTSQAEPSERNGATAQARGRRFRAPVVDASLAPGRYTLHAHHPGFAPLSRIIDLDPGEVLDLGQILLEKPTLQPEQSAPISPSSEVSQPPVRSVGISRPVEAHAPSKLSPLMLGTFPRWDVGYSIGSGTLNQVPAGDKQPVFQTGMELRWRSRWFGIQGSAEFLIKDGNSIHPSVIGYGLSVGAPLFFTLSDRARGVNFVLAPSLLYTGSTARFSSSASSGIPVPFREAQSNNFGMRARISAEYMVRLGRETYGGIAIDGYTQGSFSAPARSPVSPYYQSSPGLGVGLRFFFGGGGN